MRKKMTLFIKDIESVGAVDRGDNPEADILFWKRRVDKSLPGSMEDHINRVSAAWRDENPSPEGVYDRWVESVYPDFLIFNLDGNRYRSDYIETGKGFMFAPPVPVEVTVTIVNKNTRREATVTPDGGETKGPVMVDGFDLTGLPAETAEALSAHIEKLAAERDAALAALPEEESVEKALDPDTADLIAKFQADLAEKDEALKVEKALRRDTESVAKVRQDGLETLLGKAEEVGPVLRTLEDAAPEAYASLYGNLVAAAQRVDLAKALGELGENKGETTPEELRDAWVKKQIASDPNADIHKLRAQFWTLNPDLVAESREGK